MKAKHKKVLGILGLVLVVATTIFAATIPSPGASAATSVTDHLLVRVTSVVPNIEITDINDGETTTTSDQPFTVDYENVTNITVTLEYTDENGETQTVVLDDFAPGEQTGSKDYNLSSELENLGYGDYTITVRGTGNDGVYDEKTIEFSYLPVVAEATEDKDTGVVEVELDYAPDDGTPDGGDVASLEINVYDEDGNLVEELSPITVIAPENKVELPFADLGLEPGEYTLEIKAYDADGNELYKDFSLKIKYGVDEEGEEEDIVVPSTADTGGLFQNLNISKSDYLITGMIIFLMVAISGAIVIAKSGKRKTATRTNMKNRGRKR